MRIAVIGGGPSGLASIKSCKEENIDVVAYEKSSGIGGLWNYKDDTNIATVAKSTIINSSKEMSAYSDFVPNPDFPNYMHNSLMLKYFEEYAAQYDLFKHIVLRTEVIKVQEADDHDLTGKWIVSTKNLETNEIKSEVFDSVMICCGHHGTPNWPQKFNGQDEFKGKIIHSHSYRKPDGFENQKIVVVGIGNSGGDITAELSTVAEKVYLSTRKGSWVMNRMSPGGLPIDSYLIRRINFLAFRYFPNLLARMFENLIESRFDHELYRLKPKHGIFQQHPTINDSLPNRILSGTVAVKGDIERFESDGVVFKGEKEVTQVDSVIFATGYCIDFPFLNKRIIDNTDNKCDLYKLQYIPQLRHPQTLAFIGLMQPFGPLVNISESQTRWHVQLVKKKCKPLPSVDKMLEDVENRNKSLRKRYYKSKRHTIQVDVIPFMDEINEQFGAKPDLKSIFLNDPVLWFRLMFKPSLPYQYRLNGPNSNYEKAREAILNYENRVKAALKTYPVEYEDKGILRRITLAIFSVFVFIVTLLLK